MKLTQRLVSATSFANKNLLFLKLQEIKEYSSYDKKTLSIDTESKLRVNRAAIGRRVNGERMAKTKNHWKSRSNVSSRVEDTDIVFRLVYERCFFDVVTRKYTRHARSGPSSTF